MAFSVRGEPKSSSSFHELLRLRLRTHSWWQKNADESFESAACGDVSCNVVVRCIPNTNLVIDSRRSSRVQSLLLSRTSAETSEARLGSSSCLSPLHLSSAVSAHHTDLSMRCYRQQVGVGGSHAWERSLLDQILANSVS